MGNYAIIITGTGAHGNKDNPGDADKILEKTVRELQAAGHWLGHASITAGGRQTIIGSEDQPPAPAAPKPCCG